jgi:glycine/D-amino acid oxidase-like deaminating enzyme
MPNVAVIGAGLIGRSWSIVFARAGWDVAIYDATPAAAEQSRVAIAEALGELKEHGLAGDGKDAASRVRVAASLEVALNGASFVQENTPETLDAKRAIFAELDRLVKFVDCRQLVYRKAEGPASLPDRASGQPAASGARGRTRRRAVDGAGHRRQG